MLNKPKKRISFGVFLISGLCIGVWSFFSLGTLLVFLLVSLIAVYLYNKLPKGERRYVVSLFIVAFILRTIVASLSFMYVRLGNDAFFAPDGERYSERAFYTSLVLRGDFKTLNMYSKVNGVDILHFLKDYHYGIPPLNEYQIGPFTYFISLVYAFFGYTPLTIRFLNCLFGALIGIVVYYLAKGIFNIRTAKISYFLTLFLPSLFLHSVTGLRDTLFNFFLIVLVFAFVKLSAYGLRKSYIAVIIFCLPCLLALRDKLFIFLSVIIITLIYQLLFKQKKYRKFMAFTTILILIIVFLNSAALIKYSDMLKNQVIQTHLGYVSTVGENYKLLPEEYYSQGTMKGISNLTLTKYTVNGLAHSLLEPFPWRNYSGIKIIYFLQMIGWFFVLPFFAFGFLYTLRYRLAKAFPVLVVFFMFWLILAVTMGNIGTVFRMRDCIAPLYLLISAVGIQRFCSRENI